MHLVQRSIYEAKKRLQSEGKKFNDEAVKRNREREIYWQSNFGTMKAVGAKLSKRLE